MTAVRLPEGWPTMRAALVAVVAAGAGLDMSKVVFGPSNGPMPPRPCVRLQMLAAPAREGRPQHFSGDVISGGDDDGKLERNHQVEATLTTSVHVYEAATPDAPSADAIIRATALRTYLDDESTRDELSDAGLYVVDTSEIRNLDDLSGSTHETRRQFDAIFRVQVRGTRAVEWIETVNITPTFSGPA